MKKIVFVVMAVLLATALASCAYTPESTPDKIIEVLESKAEETVLDEGTEEEIEASIKEKTVSVHLYKEKEEKTLELIADDALCALFEGEWKETDSKGEGEKIISFTVDTQHEITFFDNGRAMVYYGFCTIFEKDRRYFEISLDGGVDALYNFAKEHGIESEEEENGVQIEF